MTLKELCEKHHVKVTYVCHGIQVEPAADNHGHAWPHKAFTVTLTMGEKKYPEAIPYKMGVTPPTRPRRGESEYDLGRRRVKEDKERDARVPAAADLVHSLLSDASCYDCAGDFKGFCADLGYSTDSIKARDIYFACGEASKRIKAFLGPLLAEFEEAARDY